MAEPVQLDPRDRLPQMAAALRDWVEHQVNTASVEHPRQTGLRDGAREAACIAVQALSGRLARPTWPEAEAWLREVAAGPRQGPLPAVTRKPGILRPRRAAGDAGEAGSAVGGAPAEPPAVRVATGSGRRVRREDVLAVLTPEPQSPAEVAARLGVDPDRIFNHLRNLLDDGLVVHVGRGAWTVRRAASRAGGTPAVRASGDGGRRQRRAPTARPTVTEASLDTLSRQVLEHLRRAGAMPVGSLAWALHRSSTDVRKRLLLLRRAGLVEQRSCYWGAL